MFLRNVAQRVLNIRTESGSDRPKNRLKSDEFTKISPKESVGPVATALGSDVVMPTVFINSLSKCFLHRKVFLVLLTALLLAPASTQRALSQSSPDETGATSTGTISGRVMNESGQPIAHAIIFVTGSAGPSQQRTTVTDDAGNFQVAGLDASLYFVRASAPSYLTAPSDPESPVFSTYRIGDSVNISMIKGGVITGTVTSATGQPLVQASVHAVMIRDAKGKPPTGARIPFERLTDDRGIYRMYGLQPGVYLVSAGGRIGFPYNPGAYDFDSPTYAPSSTRDSAAEIEVRSGEETSGVDIRHRGEAGHSISGIVNGPTPGPGNAGVSISIAQSFNGLSQVSAFAFQPPGSRGFTFYGVADGEYDVTAQLPSAPGEIQVAEAVHASVKGRDVSGLSLTLKALPSVSGHLVLEPSTAAECKNKRKPLFSETSIIARRSKNNSSKDLLAFPGFQFAQGSPDKAGDFRLRNLSPGQFTLVPRFFAKYWYLRRIERENSLALGGTTGAVVRPNDLARNGFALKLGERLNNVTVTLAEGASSIHGVVKPVGTATIPAQLYVHLVTSEKENTEDVLRFFTTRAQSDGTFSLNNLPPGRYWLLAQLSTNSEALSDAKLRAPEESETRAQIRREAEANKTEIELKPCQNVVDYQLPFKQRL